MIQAEFGSTSPAEVYIAKDAIYPAINISKESSKSALWAEGCRLPTGTGLTGVLS